MFDESQLLPLSGLQHLLYCERQWALIHLEQQWAENRLTAEGEVLHQTVDESPDESLHGVRIVRSMRLRSLQLGISGVADIVEFSLRGTVAPLPVEYKRGRPKKGVCDIVQLCAQALCLEEMLNCVIPAGALFYGKTRRRTPVAFTPLLRQQTETAALRMHEIFDLGVTPKPIYESAKCDRCSLFDLCQPRSICRVASTERWFDRALGAAQNMKVEDA